MYERSVLHDLFKVSRLNAVVTSKWKMIDSLAKGSDKRGEHEEGQNKSVGTSSQNV